VVLIDAYNVLYRVRTHRRLASWDLVALATEIARRRFFRREIVLVCDGDPPPGMFVAWNERELHRGDDALTFHFSGRGVEADDVIAGLISASLRPAGLLVVSSDQGVRSSSRKLGASEMSGETLVGWLTHWKHAPVPERPAFAEAVPLTRGEVELWLRDLGVDEAGNSVASLPSPAPAVTPRANAKRGTKPDTKQSTQRTSKPTAMPARGDSSTPPVDATLLDMERWLKLFPPSEAAKRGG
jgi:hypothetical protein